MWTASEKPAVINQTRVEGVIESYALGGATAIIFYTEPIATEDVDIFVHVSNAESVLMQSQPLFSRLKERGRLSVVKIT